MKLDKEIKKLPADGAVVILGWENRFLESTVPSWKAYAVALNGRKITIGKTAIARENHSIVLTGRNPENKDMALMFAAADAANAIPGLARKLPHYHKYSYLVFEGEEPANVAKGRWPVVDSPLTSFFPGADGAIVRVEMGKLAFRQPLASLPPVYSEERMMETAEYLSSQKLKGREIGTPEIDTAAEYIAEKFRQAGLQPGGDKGGFFQTWEITLRRNNNQAVDASGSECKTGCAAYSMKNVIGVIPGKKPEQAGESVVIGAHYDHLGLGLSQGRTGDRGKLHPGADDNASGVAVLLELARVIRENINPDRSIVFAAFTGEEEGKLGSRFYVKNEKRHPVSKTVAMVNLDTVGRLGNKKLLVLGAGSAREWAHIFRGAGFVTGVEIETVSDELDSSDQQSFRDAGVPAVQLFSGPHPDYHRPTDTPDKIDTAGLVKVASVAKEAVDYLANRPEQLSSTIKARTETETGPMKERTVSLGTIPDFAHTGKGYRLSGVVDGSPAAAAGLKEGDVIIGINESAVGGLKDFSAVLKTVKPGDTVLIKFMRDGKELAVKAEAKGR
jgi:hypothetical protein